ncbi:MAG TPA: cytochrome c-type biogenesis protein CcmH [Gammaproteobacteria bacterium]|jgi:cytochrome c-type biogenesis protein CcmH|nr:cytochrome c-type biogenesis protein CcmH [Gammaproteobacteria bacterium]
MKRKILTFLSVFAIGIGPSIAMDGLTPEQEALYQSIVHEVRCLVCQNQSIAESNAELAKDLRIEIANQIKDGKTEQDIKNFLLNRYGDFVLYEPSFNKKTVFLWLSPLLLLFLIFAWYRKISLN